MTKIEWTRGADGTEGKTWQVTHGCRVVSPGCTNCYAMRMARRLELMGQEAYTGLTQQTKAGAVWNGTVRAASDASLMLPFSWKKPRFVFVDSMADLFAEGVEDEWIDRAFAVMALNPQHTFQVLTKRMVRAREYISGRRDAVAADAMETTIFHPKDSLGIDGARLMPWPLPNIWLGVSVEDQQRADERIPDLLATPAAKRFISAEPLLGPINLTNIDLPGGYKEMLPLSGYKPTAEEAADGAMAHPALDWVIVGGESGPGARPMAGEWARSLRDQCAGAGISFFMKQMTKKAPIPDDLMIREMPA